MGETLDQSWFSCLARTDEEAEAHYAEHLVMHKAGK